MLSSPGPYMTTTGTEVVASSVGYSIVCVRAACWVYAGDEARYGVSVYVWAALRIIHSDHLFTGAYGRFVLYDAHDEHT